MSRRGLVLFVAMCVIWGIPYLLIKVALRGLGPVDLVFVRFALGAVLLVPIALSRRVKAGPLLGRWGWIVAYTIIEMGIPWVLLSDAELRISSSLSGLLVSTVPLIGVVIGVLTRSGEHHGWRRILGLAVGLVGAGVLVGFDVSSSTFGAIAEVLVVAVCYATGPNIINRKLSDLPALGVIATSLLLAASRVRARGDHPAPARVAVRTGHRGGGDARRCLHRARVPGLLRADPRDRAVRATVITYVNPAVAVTLGVLLLHERLTAGIVGGLCADPQRVGARRARRATETGPESDLGGLRHRGRPCSARHDRS